MDRDDVNRIALNGDLSMVGVTDQFPLLAQYLAGPAEAVTSCLDQRTIHEIDLTGVQALDACGCQLLVAFIRNLRQRGDALSSLKLTDDCREIIHTLGFDDELSVRECA